LCRNQTQRLVKSFQEIQNKAEKGDYPRVAAIVGKSVSLVKMVVSEERTDLNNIQKVFSQIIEHREALAEREQRRRVKQEERRNRQRNRMAA
jgi:hypothetical protein